RFSSLSGDGKGSFGNAVISGMAANLRNQPMSQTSPGVTYSIGAAGKGSVTLLAPAGVSADSQMLAGAKTLYVSADGNIFLAGTASGYDMVIGVKALSGTSNTHPLNGIYFTGILQDDATPNGFCLYASQGAANEVASTGVELAYEGANSPIDGYYDYTSANDFTFAGGGTVAYSDSLFAAGAGGNLVLSSGRGISTRPVREGAAVERLGRVPESDGNRQRSQFWTLRSAGRPRRVSVADWKWSRYADRNSDRSTTADHTRRRSGDDRRHRDPRLFDQPYGNNGNSALHGQERRQLGDHHGEQQRDCFQSRADVHGHDLARRAYAGEQRHR